MSWTHVESWDCYVTETLRAIYTCDQGFGLLRKPFSPTKRKHLTISGNDYERLGAIYNVDKSLICIDLQRG